MIEFLKNHGDLVQSIDSLIAIVAIVFAIVVFLLNRYRLNQNNEHNLKACISAFNKNNLQSLRDEGVISNETGQVDVRQLELIYKDESQFESLVAPYPGTYREIATIVEMSSELRFYRWVIRAAILLLIAASIVVVAFVVF